MSTSPRVDLLNALCALLSEHDAALIRSMPVDDLMTYVEAYAAARRSGVEIPGDLRRAYLANLVDDIEADFRTDRHSTIA